MNTRFYFSMFKNEPDVLTVPDVIRLLRIGKNTVYALIKDGTIASIKQGKKIIVPKMCLVDYLMSENLPLKTDCVWLLSAYRKSEARGNEKRYAPRI